MEMVRTDATQQELMIYLEMLEGLVKKRFLKHGAGLHISAHESYGLLAEEMHELMGGIHGGNEMEILGELGDIAICALFGMVSASKRISPQETH